MIIAEKKKYPRALPHRAPEDVADEIALWRTRAYCLLCASALLLAFTAAGTVFVVKKMRAARAPAPSVVVEEALESKPALTPDAAVPRPAPIPKSETPPRDRLLEALGSLSAAHLFQCNLNIGLLADSVESEAYTLQEADETLLAIADLMDEVEGRLDKVASADLAPEDRAAIDQIKTATVLLRIQGRLLQQYWLTGDMEDAQRYHEARNAAWKGIAKVLRLAPSE